MLIAACVTFSGANHFWPRAVAVCRPMLGLNIICHLYLIARLVHVNEDRSFFDNAYATARTILIALGCVVVMELLALKRAGLFYLKLRMRSLAELERLRAFRRAGRMGQSLVMLITYGCFLLILVVVVARYISDLG